MEISGYTYITHKLIDRPWYPECRFTVARLTDNSHINEVIRIPSMKVEEKELVKLLEVELARIDAPRPEDPLDPIIQAQADKEAEIKAYLVKQELITAEQTVWDVKTKADYASEITDGG
jgi:hypothetical protein